jgi:hypothetical protein
VELVHAYSNLHRNAMRLGQLYRDALSHARSTPERAPGKPQRVDRRFGAAMIERIVAEYVAGTPTTALAETYGIGKGTLLRLIREAGVTVRKRGLRAS